MHSKLLLASKSPARRRLLEEAQIPFEILEQSAQEPIWNGNMSLRVLVELIAKHKMDQISMPESTEGTICFVLTADTLTQNAQGTILGKPKNAAHARAMLMSFQEGPLIIATGVCLDKNRYTNGAWHTQQRALFVVEGSCVCQVPVNCIDDYIKRADSQGAAGALNIEGYGAQFCQSLSGSYTAIIGLPLFELNEQLSKLGFW